MATSRVQGFHVVGSIPLASTEDSFRTLSKALPHRLKRIPDGEPGKRWNFVSWQRELFSSTPIFLQNNGHSDADAKMTYTAKELDETMRSWPVYKAGYDEFALESYQVFKRLRDEGVISARTRFLVALPTPLTIVSLYIRTAFQARAEPLYEAALMRDLARIQAEIPPEDLAIQWDLPIEFSLLEQVGYTGQPLVWFEPILEGIIERLARLGEAVDPRVEMGYHLCYGDAGHKHFVEPSDAGKLASVANALLVRCERKIDFIHMPVMKDRTDPTFFAPLGQLVPHLGDTELMLGLVHANDLDGTRERIRIAKEFVPCFSVSTECGMGRTMQQDMESILSIANTVSDPVESQC